MYFVKYGKEYLHDPRVDGCMLLDLSLECEENSCGYCDFTIYPSHPLYNKLKEHDSHNPIKVYDTNSDIFNEDDLIFSGFIYELGKEFYLDGHVKCKGELDYLRESIVRPYSTVQRGYGNLAPFAITEYFSWIIDQHNKQVDPSKHFKVGINRPKMYSTGSRIFSESDNYPTTIEEISEKILNSDYFSGYLKVRYENGVRYIDLLPEWTDTNSQILDFGVNLTDYTQTDDAESIATFVIPLGAKMSDTHYDHNDGYFESTDTEVDQDKIYYTKEEGTFEECYSLLEFEDDVTYYEYHGYSETSDVVVNPAKTYYTYADETFTECNNLTEFEAGVRYYIYNGYSVTSDSTVNPDKTYYVCVRNNYSQCNDLTEFEAGEYYYEYNANNDESNIPLTIEGYNYIQDSGGDYYIVSDMICCHSAGSKYGHIGLKYENTDITYKSDLADLGLLVLKEYVSPKRTIEIKAVDMHLVNPSIKPIKVGEYVRVRSAPHNLDSYFLCRNITLDLNNPGNSLYTLGTTFDTLTGQQNKRINQLNAEVNKQVEAAVALSQEAKDAANSAIVSIIEEYAQNSSTLLPPNSGWTTMPMIEVDGLYIWKRLVTTYGDGSTSNGEPSLLIGNAGQDGSDAILLRIDSSRGTVFKNNSMSTVLSVIIYKGSERITDSAHMHQVFGSGAYLEWSWQRLDDETFGVILSNDSMLSNDGFSLTISAEQVDTKITFMCELKI